MMSQMGDTAFRILGIAGSLRQGSYNRALLGAAQELAPEGVDIQAFDIAPIPLFNEDVEAEGDPDPVRDLKAAIRDADALLIVTPEYNYSIPGVLKNAIDWASRPGGNSVLKGKPIAIMGASSGHFGTARAQLALRQVFVTTDSFTLPKPEVMVFRAASRFDASGNLTDEETRELVRNLVEALVAWAKRLYVGGA
jgi:chromate reductase, NAD(P)H dehydrogenase (quinone)